MDEATFRHPIYSIGHPMVTQLVIQAFEIKRFQMCFPHFYPRLKKIVAGLTDNLGLFVKEALEIIKKYETDKELEQDIKTILFDRKLIDQLLDFIQTNELKSFDIYLCPDILTKDQLKSKFEEFRNEFWDAVDAYSEDIEILFFQNMLRVLLSEQGWYLPNLLPDWSIDELLQDYVVLFLNYHLYENSSNKVENKNSYNQPNVEDIAASIRSINSYRKPVPRARGNNFKNLELNDMDSQSLSFNISLMEDSSNFLKIIKNFLLDFPARKVDYLRKGTSEKIKYSSDQIKLHEILDSLLKQIDRFENQNYGFTLSRADEVISALISLIYLDDVLDFKLEDLDNRRIQGYNIVEIFNSSIVGGEIDDEIIKMKRELEKEKTEFFKNKENYKISSLKDKLILILNEKEDLNCEFVKVLESSTSKFTHLRITHRDSGLCYELPLKDFKGKIKSKLRAYYIDYESRRTVAESHSSLGVGAIFTAVFDQSLV